MSLWDLIRSFFVFDAVRTVFGKKRVPYHRGGLPWMGGNRRAEEERERAEFYASLDEDNSGDINILRDRLEDLRDRLEDLEESEEMEEKVDRLSSILRRDNLKEEDIDRLEDVMEELEDRLDDEEYDEDDDYDDEMDDLYDDLDEWDVSDDPDDLYEDDPWDDMDRDPDDDW